MADLTGVEAAQSVKVIGSDSTGTETNPVNATDNNDLQTADILNNGGLDTILNIVSGVPQELKVGASRKANRKYIIMEALDTGMKWGFSSSTQSFDLFKSQLIMVPVGENTEIWFDCDAGTKDVAIAEVS